MVISIIIVLVLNQAFTAVTSVFMLRQRNLATIYHQIVVYQIFTL